MKNKMAESFLQILPDIQESVVDNFTKISSSDTSSPSSTFTISPDEYDQFKKIINEAREAAKNIEKIEKDAKSAVEKAEGTAKLVYLGFVILLVMVAGMFLDQVRFVFEGQATHNETFLDRLNTQETEIVLLKNEFIDFKKCLRAGGWNICLAQ